LWYFSRKRKHQLTFQYEVPGGKTPYHKRPREGKSEQEEGVAMKEYNLRRWHRSMGITLALFIMAQGGSGFLISLSGLSTPHSHAHSESVAPPPSSDEHEASIWHRLIGFIHYGDGAVGSVYRILVGTGIVGMALTGSAIFFKSRTRFKKGPTASQD
jgi:hypothetical protein